MPSTPSTLPSSNPAARRKLPLVLAAGLAAALASSGASAADRGAPVDPLAARVSGAEFRGYAKTHNALEDHMWRFKPDGQVTLGASRLMNIGTIGARSEGGTSPGRWWVKDGQLCVDFTHFNYRHVSGCYTVVVMQGDHVRLAGPAMFEGTLSR